jgi:Leucine-rich repeat (LRR) protein
MKNFYISVLVSASMMLVSFAADVCYLRSDIYCLNYGSQFKSYCETEYCLNYKGCDGIERLPCHKNGAIFVSCISVNTKPAEIPSSMGNCNSSVINYGYALELTSKNYSIVKSGIFTKINITYFDLSFNEIDHIEPSAFDSIIGLKDLNLNGNNLENVTFGNVTKLILKLSINTNRIKFINKDSFSSLADLRYINLESNMIEFIDKQAFSENKQLKTIVLLNNKLKDIEFKSSSLICLNFEMNQLQRLRNYTFNGFNSLRVISLSGNYINSIEKDAFYGLSPVIQTLNLDHNEFESIDSVYFQSDSFRSLKYLDLSENKIELINNGSFSLLTSLLSLILESNKIQYLLEKSFNSLKFVNTLDLSNQMLVQLNSSEIFSGMSRLATLYLNNNMLEALLNNTFVSLLRLDTLFIESNLIESIEVDAFKGLSKMTNLSIARNLITNLKGFTFNDLKNVIYLNLEENRVAKIDENAFVGICKSLKYLYVGKNKLQFIKNTHLNNLSSLVRLDLSDNQISSIEVDSFRGLVSLEWLNLQDNSIFKIEPRLFLNQLKLKTLILTSNTINELENGSFQYLKSLEELFLNDNLITSPNTGLFSNLTKLKLLYLNDNLLTFIDFSCFDDLKNLTELRLTSAPLIQILTSKVELFPSLKSLHLENTHINLIQQFNLSRNINRTSFKGSVLNRQILQSISTDFIVEIDLSGVIFNESIEDSLKSFSSNLININLSGLNMSAQFQSKLLSQSVNIEKLYLSNCNLTTNDNLNSFSKLKLLDLSLNKISRLPAIKTKELVELNISNNQLTYIDYNTFWGLNTIQILDLSHNSLTNLKKATFSNLKFLRKLDLSYNNLTIINTEHFGQNKLDKLKYLDLSFNPGLFSIEFDIFSIYFDRVNLNNMSLSDISTGFFNNIPYINEFMSDKNKITVIKKSYFNHVKSIKRLWLSSNLIHSIEDNAFFNLKILLTLDLSMNNLTRLNNKSLNGLIQLQYLNLSSNRINFIEKGIFDDLKRIEKLDLSNNLIQSIADSTFYYTNKLKFLYIQQNSIITFFKKNILTGIETVKYVFVGDQVQMGSDECETIRSVFKPVKVKSVVYVDYYDLISIDTESASSNEFDLKNFTRKNCESMNYLLRNNIQLNLFHDFDVHLFLTVCSDFIKFSPSLKHKY